MKKSQHFVGKIHQIQEYYIINYDKKKQVDGISARSYNIWEMSERSEEIQCLQKEKENKEIF